MKLPDTNVWLALTFAKHPHHSIVKNWWSWQSQPGSITFCRATQQAFLRLVTTSTVTNQYGLQAATNREAWVLYSQYANDSRVCWHSEPSGLDVEWKQYTDRTTASPKIWMDAYLAALAKTLACDFVTFDQAFRQFSGLNVELLAGP